MAERATLLITAVGSGVGRTLLLALQGRRKNLRIVGLNSEAEAPELFSCDSAWLVPPTADDGFGPRLQAILATEQPDLVLPGRDEDVLALALLGEARPALAPRLLVGSVAAARLMAHKQAMADFAQARGLPFVPTLSTDAPDAAAAAQQLVARFGFPLITKPASGNGSRGVRVLLGPAPLARALQRRGQVLQPMIDAPPPAVMEPGLEEGVPLFWELPEPRLYAVRGWIGRDARVRQGCVYEMTMSAGRYVRMALLDDAGLAGIGEAYGHALAAQGWRGPYHLQCKRDAEGRYWPIELHGRLGGGTAGRALLGHDELGELLRHWLGDEVLPRGMPARAAVVVARPDECGLPAAALATLRAQGRWTV